MTPSSLAIAYLDPTALIPVVFGEEPVEDVTQERLDKFPVLMSYNFLTDFVQLLRTGFRHGKS